MRKAIVIASVLSICGLVAAGCATAHKASDEDMIRTTVLKVKDALEKKDLDLLMATFSDSYKDARVGGKAEARALLSQGLNSGYADGGKVSVDEIKVTVADDKKSAKVYPLDLSSTAGSIAVELVLAREKDGWLITAVHADGV